MGELKVGSIEIGKERFCIQVVGPVALDRPAILQQGKLRKVHVLSVQAHHSDQAVIALSLDGSARHVKVCPAVQVAQHSSSMSLQVQCSGDRNILPNK